MKDDKEEVWAIVELMGHVRLAGRLAEEEHFGAKMGRLDIPQGDGFVTQLFGGGSVYRITVVTEEVARHVCKQASPAPVSPWDFPKQLPAPQEPSRVYEACGHTVEDCDCDPDDGFDNDEQPH